MTNASFVQTNFLGGEWSALASGRMDHPRYKTALARCYNSLPVEEGSCTRRPGTRHGGHVRDSGDPTTAGGKLLPFRFNQANPIALELTSGNLRTFNGKNYSVLDSAAVSSISTAKPAVVTLSASVSWTGVQTGLFSFGDINTQFNLAQLAVQRFKLTITSPTTGTLADEDGNPVDGSQFTWNSAYALTFSRVQTLTTPYTGALWRDVRIVQSQKQGLLLHAAVIPQVLAVTTDPQPNSDAQFSITPAAFQDGPYLDQVKNSTITPTGTSGQITVQLGFSPWLSTVVYNKGDYAAVGTVAYQSLVDSNVNLAPASNPASWAVVNQGASVGPSGFVPTDIGRLIRLYNATPGAAYASGTTYGLGDFVTYNGVGYRSLQASNTGHQPDVQPAWWSITSPGWTWGKIVSLTSAGIINPAAGTHFGQLAPLNAAFDGTVLKTAANCAVYNYGGVGNHYSYLGQDYGASPQACTSATWYPATDVGFATEVHGYPITSVTLNLYGSNTAPTSSGNGTFLGTSGAFGNRGSAVTVLNTVAPATAYRYIWMECILTTNVYGWNTYTYCAQLQFFNASLAPGSAASVQLLGPQLPNTNLITSWRIGAYSDTTGWPTCGCYHEGRFWLGGAIPNRFDASVSNSTAFNFSPTQVDGTVADSNAIAATFNSASVSTIFWLKPDLQGIVVGTQEGEYLLQATSANAVMTPLNIQGHLVTHYGCANIEPVHTGLTSMFVQKQGRRVHEYLSDIFSGRFFAPNATEFAKHLTQSGIKELAYQEEYTPIVWARLANGSLSGTTFRRVALSSSSEPLFNGWHGHELGSGRVIESIISGPSPDGGLDTVTMITNDPETGRRHIEVMTNIMEEDDTIFDAWYLDDAVVPAALKSVTIGSGTQAVRVMGLHHLEGKKVTAWIAGLDCGDYQVVNGQFDVLYESDPDKLFTHRFLTQVSASGPTSNTTTMDGLLTIPAIVGFTYTSQGQLLRPNDPAMTGAQQGPAFGKSRRIHQWAGLFQGSQGVSVGTTFDHLYPVLFSSPGGKVLPKNQLFSGMFQGTIESDSTLDGQICWQITRPYPATVAAIGGMLATQDR